MLYDIKAPSQNAKIAFKLARQKIEEFYLGQVDRHPDECRIKAIIGVEDATRHYVPDDESLRMIVESMGQMNSRPEVKKGEEQEWQHVDAFILLSQLQKFPLAAAIEIMEIDDPDGHKDLLIMVGTRKERVLVQEAAITWHPTPKGYKAIGVRYGDVLEYRQDLVTPEESSRPLGQKGWASRSGHHPH